MLTDLQERLYAQDRWSVLLIFQALDAAGKDGTIKHVMSRPQPAGLRSAQLQGAVEPKSSTTTSCGARHVKLPRRGHIGIFNRSYYEEMLVVRVHPEILARQQLPESSWSRKKIWSERFEDVVAYERYLAGKAWSSASSSCYVSKEEQRQRFLARLDEPEKNWKFSLGDVHEREHFDDYLDAYEDAIRHTATHVAPWYVVPADRKWFTRLVVASAVIEAIESIDPTLPGGRRRDAAAAAGGAGRARKRGPGSKARRERRDA